MNGYRPNGNYGQNHLCRKLPGYREKRKKPNSQPEIPAVTEEKCLKEEDVNNFTKDGLSEKTINSWFNTN